MIPSIQCNCDECMADLRIANAMRIADEFYDRKAKLTATAVEQFETATIISFPKRKEICRE